MSICVSVCVSGCLSVQAITFELLKFGTSFLAYMYILTISMSPLSIKVTGSRSNEKLTYFYITITSVDLHATKTYLKVNVI